jgi:hypothetical protein
MDRKEIAVRSSFGHLSLRKVLVEELNICSTFVWWSLGIPGRWHPQDLEVDLGFMPVPPA